MRDSVNKEGLTFEEWVCAAGVANFTLGTVRPYCETTVRYLPTPRPAHLAKVVVLYGPPRPVFGIKKKDTNYFYSKKIREAWRNGEDPTEWRV